MTRIKKRVRKDGKTKTYRVQWCLGGTRTGEWQSETFDQKAEAVEERTRHDNQRDLTRHILPTFGELDLRRSEQPRPADSPQDSHRACRSQAQRKRGELRPGWACTSPASVWSGPISRPA
ncbi:hypothetical protein J5X84_42250 [Streptosporangiaceae bacterium NEAU-GS5]|nr:hypothetical protein [Streptosporangiaceae bacterium NEAU-GS5]